jgi:WhiB family redox-sensing transcriptional regulator
VSGGQLDGFTFNRPSPATEPWVEDAVCAQTDPEAFFPEGKGASARAAKKICVTCPVEAECLEWALINDERFGVWGNTSPRQRSAMRARLGLTTTSSPDGDESA